MAWKRVTLEVAGEHAEALAEAFEAEGAISVEVADALSGTSGERPLFGEPGASAALWPRCRVSALFAEDADASRGAEMALAAAGCASLAPAMVEPVEDADWVAEVQRQFDPIRIGHRLWIVPSWHSAPAGTGVPIVLDPGAAFGTGSHPTTRLCLEWLESRVGSSDTVLDYGCGSGILGIAALKLGARAAIGVDVDPLALEAARYNAERNGVALRVVSADEGIDVLASMTVANILANPLRMLAPLIAAHTRVDGAIALSGILAEQAAEVAADYRPWAKLDVTARDADWVLLSGVRHR